MATDKIQPTASLKAIKREVKKPEPYRLALSDSKVITFPDIFDQDSEAAETLMAQWQTGQLTHWQFLDQWLSEKDAAALRKERLTLRELLAVVQSAQTYYEGIWGTQGEEDASDS